MEAENHYRLCVDDANARHRNLLGVKSRVLQQIRELLMQADQTMKAVTVSYFQQQHTLTAPCPVQFQVSWKLAKRSGLDQHNSEHFDEKSHLIHPLNVKKRAVKKNLKIIDVFFWPSGTDFFIFFCEFVIVLSYNFHKHCLPTFLCSHCI